MPSLPRLVNLALLFVFLLAPVSKSQYSFRDTRGSGVLLGQNPCVSKQTCSECMQTPTCAWCKEPDYSSADGSPLPRCNQEEFYVMSSRYFTEDFIRSYNFFFAGSNVQQSTLSTPIICFISYKMLSYGNQVLTRKLCKSSPNTFNFLSG